MSFWGELRRRNVFRVGMAYLIAAWLIVQVVSTISGPLGLPPGFETAVLALVAVGFPIALLFAWAFEITPEGIKKTADVPYEQSITHVTGQKLNYAVTALLVAAVAFMAVDNYVLHDSAAGTPAPPTASGSLAGSGSPTAAGSATGRGSRTDSGSATAAGSPTTASIASPAANGAQRVVQTPARAVLRNSIAVLPLDNLSPDPNNAYVAAGLHEEILNQLAKLRNLSVIARTSVMQFGEDRPSIAEIAQTLNVQSVMEGSIRYAGDRIRVTTQLIDAATDSQLWSETYDRKFDDVFAIESDIAMNVANALAAEFSPEEQQRVERQPTSSPEAYGLYLQAINLLGVGEQAPRMEALLDQAIALDPDFAMAYGAKAALNAQQLINTTEGSARSWAELEALIRETADRALALDPADMRALLASGLLATYSWRWTDARAAFDHVYEVSNSSPATAAWFLPWSGDPDEGLKRSARTVELDPSNWQAHWSRGIVLNGTANYDEAAQAFRDAIAIVPVLPLEHSWLAMTEIARGNNDEARDELQLTEQLAGGNRSVILLLDLAYGYGRIGDRDDAQRLVDEIEGAVTNKEQEIGAGGAALTALAAGNTDEALEWLRRGGEKAAQHEPDAGFYSLMNLKLNYTNDPVLERPEFAAARERLTGQ